MLEDKRENLESARQRRLLDDLVSHLSHEDPNIYYMPTSGIAALLYEAIKSNTVPDLNQEKQELLKRMSLRDIEVMLSLH